MEYKFWMVKAENGGAPNKVHNTQEAATEEAKRLAKQHQGARFYVLEAMTVWATAEPIVTGITVERAPICGTNNDAG
jgi:hypothetical protein